MILRSLCLIVALALSSSGSVWSASPKVEFKQSQYKIDVLVNGKLFTSYLHTPDPAHPMVKPDILQTKPVLFPIHSPSGMVLTRAYPFASVPGEASDHPHHQGLFFTVDNVGPDKDGFWGNSKSPLPAIKHVKVQKIKGGNGSGTLAVLSQWVGKSGKPLLDEEREMVFRAAAPDRIEVDFTIYLKALGQDITITDTKEGMFAMRMAQWFVEKQTGRYLNANGDTMEAGVWGKRANWIRLQGEKDGKQYGVAILSHPSGVNSPTWWHARGYGLFSVNPIGQLDFEKERKAASPTPFNLTIKAGQKALFKYRVVFYDGDMDKAKIDTLYQAFAK
jgi:hypothetical protein